MAVDAPELPYRALTGTELRTASGDWYSATVAGELFHPPDPLLTLQLGRATRSATGDPWRLVGIGGHAIDALLAYVMAGWSARERQRSAGPQVFL
jgi:hypothetical protein